MGIRKRNGKNENLRRELVAVRRENAVLKRELAEARRALEGGRRTGKPSGRPGKGPRRETREERVIMEAHRLARRFGAPSLLRYLWVTVSESALGILFNRLWLYLRRVRLVQTVLSVVVAVGTVAAVAALWLAVLPFLVAGAGGVTVWVAICARRMDSLLERELAGRRVRVLIPSRGRALSEGSFFIRSARSMAVEEGVVVLVVSPYLVFRRGLGGKGGFMTARKEGEGLYLLRRHYYFALRRRVLDRMKENLTVIY